MPVIGLALESSSNKHSITNVQSPPATSGTKNVSLWHIVANRFQGRINPSVCFWKKWEDSVAKKNTVGLCSKQKPCTVIVFFL